MPTNITVTRHSTAADIIEMAVMEVAGVTNCEVLFNNTFTTCPYTGIPPMSIKVVVHGDFKGKEVAKAIWNNRSAGILCVGSKVKRVKDSFGYKHEVRFEVVK